MNLKSIRLRIKLFSIRLSARAKGMLFKLTPNLKREEEAPPAPYIVHMGMGVEQDLLGKEGAVNGGAPEASKESLALKAAVEKSRKSAQGAGSAGLALPGASARGSDALRAGLSGRPRKPADNAQAAPQKPRSAALPVGIPMGQPQAPTIEDLLGGLDTSLASGRKRPRS